jgi:hypothetical protein
MSAFPSFWRKMDALVASRRVIISQAAVDELAKKSDETHDWVVSKKEMICGIDMDVQVVVREILANPNSARLVDTKKGRSGADPFVIALAEIVGATVITNEALTGGKSPRIPDVCGQRGVQCGDLLHLIRGEGWVF